MKFVADLHLHSKYSRAVSTQMSLANMASWGKMKGISVLASSDFTHPFWFEQLKNELVEEGNGLYKLKGSSSTMPSGRQVSSGTSVSEDRLHFILSCEISSIYSQGGKGRRIHNLFYFPTLESVEKFNKELIKRGANLRSDGRPIVGISSRNLAEIALSCNEKVLIIPAHAWTPWFSLYGSFSGFDSVEECFGDMAKYIYGIETGLSSDPAMNWKVSDLDNRAIISSSDAHSLEKMGREATVFEAEDVSYDAIYGAVVGKGKSKIAFTIEFYPEEGKYHFSGHRNCNFSASPSDTKTNGSICPVCRRPLTIGVMHRVQDLGAKEEYFEVKNLNDNRWVRHKNKVRPPYVSLVPLLEIIAECFSTTAYTKRVKDVYFSLVNSLGTEFSILMKTDLAEIAKISGPKVSEAIGKVRAGEIFVEPGYDGKFGVVKIWGNSDSLNEEKKEAVEDETQLNLFA